MRSKEDPTDEVMVEEEEVPEERKDRKHRHMFSKKPNPYGEEYDEDEDYDEEYESEDDQYEQKVFNQQSAFGTNVFPVRQKTQKQQVIA